MCTSLSLYKSFTSIVVFSLRIPDTFEHVFLKSLDNLRKLVSHLEADTRLAL